MRCGAVCGGALDLKPLAHFPFAGRNVRSVARPLLACLDPWEEESFCPQTPSSAAGGLVASAWPQVPDSRRCQRDQATTRSTSSFPVSENSRLSAAWPESEAVE